MPVFGLGTWQMGGRFDRDPNNNDAADIQAIKNAIDAGIIHIDTAEVYAAGWAEKLIAQAVKGYDRKKLFLVSKAPSADLSYDVVLKSAKASLRRLETDYLDLYLLHGPDLKHPIKETMKALDVLVAEGLVKNIGVCNFTVERFTEAQSHTQNRLVANQVHYNLIFREPERKGVVEYCQKNDVLLIAWRPVQKGILTTTDNPFMKILTHKYQKTPSQIAINWLISQPNVVTLSKMTNPEHLKENLGALDWKLEKEDIEKLDKEFPNQQDVSDAVPLI